MLSSFFAVSGQGHHQNGYRLQIHLILSRLSPAKSIARVKWVLRFLALSAVNPALRAMTAKGSVEL